MDILLHFEQAYVDTVITATAYVCCNPLRIRTYSSDSCMSQPMRHVCCRLGSMSGRGSFRRAEPQHSCMVQLACPSLSHT
jgi:hypothetical protein